MTARDRIGPLAAVLLVLLSASARAENGVELDCVINPSETVRLSTAEPGLIAAVNVRRGDEVEAGDVVAELVADAESTAVDLARARAEDETGVAAADGRVDMLRKRLARNEKLEKSKIVSAAALEEIRAEVLVAEQEAEAARTARVQAELEQRRAEQLLARRRIVSPVSGVVVERLLSPGEYFNETDHVATIAVLDPLYIEAFAPVALYDAIHEGEIATVIPEEPIGGVHPAEVAVVDKVLDAASGTYGVRLHLENPDFVVPAGVNCRVRFRVGG